MGRLPFVRRSAAWSWRPARFGVVGAANTALGLGVFAVVTRLGAAPLQALAVSHVVTLPVSFTAHRRVVFRVRGRWWGDLWRFESLTVAAMAANAALLLPLVHWVKVPPLRAEVVVTAALAVASYLGHRSVSFARSELPA